ncbi:MAG: DNA polymerase III subunit beta [Acidobacteriaceae bacterium]|nr:DNA polymerase III subunit beta [Acidobacteriaceae bacterium]MBV9765491.1 DNA polymerase III subunit beta [Acidobacteriaceae bacterium]
MEFSVSKSDLVRELALTQGVVERKTTIPILSNILVETDHDQDQVWLTATDLELGIRCACPARIKKEGAGTIPARRLLDYVRLLPDADLQVKLAENQWASFICGRSRTRIAGMSRESFPELPQMPETLAEIPLSVLSQMISSTIFAISAEESRFTLNGALLILKENGIVMVSTDGHRLALIQKQVDLPGLENSYRALLPKKAMNEIQKLASDDSSKQIEFSGNENHLFFRIDKRLLLSRKLTGNFPDYERVLPKEHPHTLVIQRDELRSAIERVAQFADERSRAIRLQMVDGELKVHSSISETGESEETIPVEYSGPDVEIGFNAQYLLDFLRSVEASEVEFHFKDSNSAGELQPRRAETGADAADTIYRYVVMPMRI